MDHAAWLDGKSDEEAQDAYQYFMRPDPNQKEFLGPIMEEDDPYTGTVARYRTARVGMVRNAKDEDKKEVKVYLGFNGKNYLPHLRVPNAKRLQGWYQEKHNDKKGSRVRPCFSEAVLTEPYGGYCTVGCAFCYINSGFRGYRGSGLITVPMHYGDQVQGMLAKHQSSSAGYFSSFTDPFLPIEDIYHNTQRGAEAFTNLGLPVFYLSRLPYPGWAYDSLKLNKYSYAQKSLNTGNDEDWHKLSPGAMSLQGHIDEVAELRRQGIYTSIQVNPILPGITSHDDIRHLFERLAAVNNNHVIVKFVEAGYSWAPAMVSRLHKRFGPLRGQAFANLFTENQAGSQKTIVSEYRLEAHAMYQKWATELGMTYATCYEYRRKKPEEGKGWMSVGREYTTADQCHGQRVPMFTRTDLKENFEEVVDCPPSGCLYCAEESDDGEPKCGDEVFGNAGAVRGGDYKRIISIKSI